MLGQPAAKKCVEPPFRFLEETRVVQTSFAWSMVNLSCPKLGRRTPSIPCLLGGRRIRHEATLEARHAAAAGGAAATAAGPAASILAAADAARRAAGVRAWNIV